MFKEEINIIINRESGINHYRNRIKMIDKSNKKVVCHLCNENEDWNYVMLYEKNKDNRKHWAKELEKKLKNMEQNKNVEEEEKAIVQENVSDINKNFNYDKNSH